MIHRIGETIRQHKFLSTCVAGAAFVAFMSVRAETEPTDPGYISWHSSPDANIIKHWPLRADPWQYIHDYYGGNGAVKKAERVRDAFGSIGKEPEVSPTVPYANNALVVKAANRLKSDGLGQHCPLEESESDYRIPFEGEENDKTAVVCLQTDELKIVNQGKNTTIVFPVAVSTDYSLKDKFELKDSLSEFSHEQCKPKMDRMASYGRYLLEKTNILPAYTTARVGIVVEYGRQNNCDTIVPPA